MVDYQSGLSVAFSCICLLFGTTLLNYYLVISVISKF